eukprot:CAMPEP_0119015270 /NCGR_PEP_ID=MMETSP1176-20130426/10725_1 /TAXON_ID=265551 /ORGANISM="Synedropsis recta cf, Strain CCMP1620" /LENGTH=283 /DNA_ID=CAMNT_0006968549 /DNA_START=54 /DNA_END=905 /DNA_ORIENTATION=-
MTSKKELVEQDTDVTCGDGFVVGEQAPDDHDHLVLDPGEKEMDGKPPEKETDDDDDDFSALQIILNLFFVAGSVLYLIMAVEALDWYKYERLVPDDVLDADDDYSWEFWYNETDIEAWEDDYIFQVNDAWVTRYMMFYFAAAMCFLATGLLSWWSDREWFSIMMIIAASFGIASSMLIVKNEWLSIVFNSVSVHLFALEAFTILATRRAKYRWLFAADIFFMAGNVMDVVLSYFHVNDTFELPHARTAIAAAFFWLACSVVYLGTVIYGRVRQRGAVSSDTTS